MPQFEQNEESGRRRVDELFTAWHGIREGVDRTVGHNRFEALRDACEERPLLVIAASGNSAYPARYLEWLLSTTTSLDARAMTPLEYGLTPPRRPHCCLLISQGARRRDSYAVLELACRQRAPLFVLCGRHALETQTVASEIDPARVFVTDTRRERAFLNLIGTGAAFAVCYELAAFLSDLAPWPAIPWDAMQAVGSGLTTPLQCAPILLHGPAGRCAAEAFAGYHCESLGPALPCDMKNFTHGVWRGLRKSGRSAVYLLVDRQVGELARSLHEVLARDHDAVLVQVPSPSLAVEPFVLFLLAAAHWIVRCEARATADPDWTPLHLERAHWEDYLSLTAYDITRGPGAGEGPRTEDQSPR